MIIRPACADDAEAIAAIHNAVIQDTLVTFTTELRTAASVAVDISNRQYLVAELNGQVIGFATYGPFRGGPGYAHTREHSIHLTPDAQGQGIGRALMAALEDTARAEGVHVLVAGISSANPGAIAFHTALGFAEVGRMPEVGRKQGQWLDLVLMQKILSPQ
ncbi:GNAT family N-acetyltransferase [Ruegeria sp.]|uniref:GNAT family N-acetyltransferase n=1 Tax=Ruegeria sp. TaxID=1879320 RepID=UPI00230B20FB|nr:GNAT family N-acetyltransferase [Ruegeria sp.]MDA7965114.1 GNAT family N-acetyltransferase [Ruegeria sp.]